MIVLLYMWQKKALNIYRSFCGISFSTKTFKKILVTDALKHQATQLYHKNVSLRIY